MFKCTDEEWYAAMESEEFKSARTKASEAYNRASSRFRKMAKALDDREAERLQKLQELEKKRDWEHRQKLKELEEKARRAGTDAENKVAFETIRSIVLKKRKEKK